MLNLLKILLANLRKGPSTIDLPSASSPTPKRYRGRIELNAEKCLTCGICHYVCPAGAINLTPTEDGSGVEFRVYHNTCTFCGSCSFYCPTKAIQLTNDWHLAHLQQDKYTMCETKFVEYPTCKECGKRMMPSLNGRHLRLQMNGVSASDIIELCPDCRRKKTATRHLLASKTLLPSKGNNDRNSAKSHS